MLNRLRVAPLATRFPVRMMTRTNSSSLGNICSFAVLLKADILNTALPSLPPSFPSRAYPNPPRLPPKLPCPIPQLLAILNPSVWLSQVRSPDLPEEREDSDAGKKVIQNPAPLKWIFARVPTHTFGRNTGLVAQPCLPQSHEAAGLVSTARIERPPLYRGGSASTETIPAASLFPSQTTRCASTAIMLPPSLLPTVQR